MVIHPLVSKVKIKSQMKKQLLSLLCGGILVYAPCEAKTLYGYQVWEPYASESVTGPVSFDASNPGDCRIIADCSDLGHVYSGYYLNYHWYGQVIVKGTQSSVEGFYDIDLATGRRTPIVKGGSKLIDMTYDYSTGKVWGIQNGSRILVSFDPVKGTNTQIGIFKEGTQEVYLLCIAASLDGKLYGVSSTDNFYSIDPATAQLTLIGALGADAAFDQTMAFDYSDGTLYWVNNGDYLLYTIDVSTGEATPIGYIGENGGNNMASLFMPYINVANGTPDRVIDPAGTGAASSATLTWTNPSTTAQGDPLTELGGIRILRDGVEIARVECTAASIGKPASYVDNNLEGGRDYTYSLVPYNSRGDGGVDAQSTVVRVGKDLPGAVGNLTAVQGDGSAILSWTVPTEGASQGLFDPADITGYEVRRGNALIATTAPDVLSYEDARPFGTYSYSVCAVSASGAGPKATVENVVVKPADWIVMTSGEAKVASGKTYKFYDEGGPSGDYYNSRNSTLIISPEDPDAYVTVDFTAFDLDTYGDYLTIYHGRGTEGECLGSFYDTSVPAELRHIESTADDGSLTFLFYSDIMAVGAGWEATVQAVAMRAHDLEATSLQADPLGVAGTEEKVTVTITNKGTAPASGYKVSLLANGAEVASADGPALESRRSGTVELSYTPMTDGTHTLAAVITYAADENPDNNTTPSVLHSVMPQGSIFVESFTENPTFMYILPASFLARESLGQTIYYADALAQGKGLGMTALTFMLDECTKGYADVPFRLWVGETERTDLVDGPIPASSLTEVFHGTLDINAGDTEVTFPFGKAYQYGGGNFVYLLYKEASPTDNDGVSFRGCYGYEKAHDNISRFDSNWYADSDPLNPDGPFGYSAQNMRPDIRVVFGPSAGIGSVTVSPKASFTLAGTTLTCHNDARVYTVTGALAASVKAGTSTTLAPGIYIVSTGGTAQRIVVR